MPWTEAAALCALVYGSYVDMEERFFICPDCEEMIFEDYCADFIKCPICEFEWKEEE